MEIRLKFGVAPSRLVYAKRGRHSFGGPSIHRGAKPRGSKLPVHRILTLDTRDPLFPLDGYSHETLPLYFPLAFSTGGGQIQYSVISDKAIRVIHLSDAVSDDEPYVNVDQFPVKRGNLVAFTYEEVRTLAMLDCPWNPYQPSKSDLAKLKKLDSFSSILVGANLLSCQGEIVSTCHNKACDWHGMTIKAPIFALVPCDPIHAGKLWHEYANAAELCFCLCRSCGSIIAVNRCT